PYYRTGWRDIRSGGSHSARHIEKSAPYRCGTTAGAKTGRFSDPRFACQGTQEIRAKESAQTFPILQTLAPSVHRGEWVGTGSMESEAHIHDWRRCILWQSQLSGNC